MITTVNWKINGISEIVPEEFFDLIDRNREHISKTFPVTVAGCNDLEKPTAFIASAIENEQGKENYYFYLRDMDTNSLIGYVCIKNINTQVLKCELAYFVDKDLEGRGIITKAVGETVSFCFDELQMNKVFICTSKENFGSQKIATKQGFQQEGVLREEFKNGEGVLEDIVYWGLLKSEYDDKSGI